MVQETKFLIFYTFIASYYCFDISKVAFLLGKPSVGGSYGAKVALRKWFAALTNSGSGATLYFIEKDRKTYYLFYVQDGF